MASLSYEKRGGKRQARLWFEVNGERKSVRIGETSKRAAENALSHIRELETCRKLADTPQAKTLEWLSQIDDDLHAKLAGSGLIETRVRKSVGEFLKDWSADDSISMRTRQKRTSVRATMIEEFGEQSLLNEITKDDAERFHKNLLEKFSSAHANKLTKIARQALKKALDFGLINSNPFSVLRIGGETNPSRQRFIGHDVIETVIEAATDNEFKLIIALARYAGLRIPSEIVTLKWGHVNWEKSMIEITDTKRKQSRFIPIFAELRPYLEAMWNEAPEGTEYVVRRYRSPDVNLRTRLEKTIKRAGVQSWPKL